MTRFLATFLGTPQAREASGWDSLDDATRKLREREGMDAWMQWMQDHASAVVEGGSPLGKAKRIDKRGVSDTRNALTAWVVVQAESADAAACMFEGHPHFTIFPGEAVEITECLPMPKTD
jgi:hypothetical protein